MTRDLSDWIARSSQEAPDWRQVFGMTGSVLWLDVDEAREAEAAVRTLIEKYRNRTKDDHPKNARRVRLAVLQYPADKA